MEKRTTILSEGAVADLTGCGKSLNRDDSPPQGLKPSLVLHDLRGAKAPLYHSAAGFRDFFRSCSAVRNLLLASLPHPLIHPIIYGLVPKLGILRLQDPMAFFREIEHLRRHAQPLKRREHLKYFLHIKTDIE